MSFNVSSKPTANSPRLATLSEPQPGAPSTPAQSPFAAALRGGGMTAQAPAVEQKPASKQADAWQAVIAELARDCAKYCDLAAQGVKDGTVSPEARGQLQGLLLGWTEMGRELQSERPSPLALAANLKAGNGEN
ncbi:hypothetical protein DB032_19005 [Chromobacterium sp. Panama]|uniref:hypothetical protein n=1 Tax=Chromobacterium sp. Panama TaxID=2161826 RepID=UPI000D31E3EE|nr:hypothetical protein [Chromobacterium sp. Panama]PTU66865.1 hypothetical protein DB032_19005 [Chromobacterium sp. Panama]